MAFPTTSLLDAFNRTDVALNGDGNWTSPMVSGDSALSVATNACANTGGGFGSAFWSVTSFAADQEVYAVISTVPADGSAIEIWGRVTGGGGASPSAYFVDVSKAAGTDQWSIWKSVSGAQSQIGAAVGQELTAGDSVGLEISGTTITAYIKTGGTWTSVLSRSDSAVSGSGNIGLVIQNTTARVDDFSGGAIVASATVDGPLIGGLHFSRIRRF